MWFVIVNQSGGVAYASRMIQRDGAVPVTGEQLAAIRAGELVYSGGQWVAV